MSTIYGHRSGEKASVDYAGMTDPVFDMVLKKLRSESLRAEYWQGWEIKKLFSLAQLDESIRILLD